MYTTKCQVRARRSHKDFPNNLTKCGCHICHPGLRTQEAPHQCQVRLVAQWGQGHQQGPPEGDDHSLTHTMSKHNTTHNGNPAGHREEKNKALNCFQITEEHCAHEGPRELVWHTVTSAFRSLRKENWIEGQPGQRAYIHMIQRLYQRSQFYF